MTISQMVHELFLDKLKELTSDYEQFECDGSIPNCYLRRMAERAQRELGLNSGFPVILWIEKVAFEAYRELYKRLQHLLSEEVG
jgi:hypothetical protein